MRLLLLLAACSSNSSPKMADMTAPPDLAPVTGLGELMPQVLQLDANNSVLSHPKIVAVTWDNDAHRADIEAFFPQYAQSKAWAAQTAEYRVGALTVGTPLHLTGNAPAAINDGDLAQLIPQPEAGTLYGFFVPDGSVLDDGTGSKCCTDYDGYHADMVLGALDVPYFVACQCPMFDGPNVGDLQQLTTVAGHELVEAATDPLQNGFAETDPQHAVWTYVSDGEVADLCQYNDTTYWQPSDMSYTVQRTWSNRAAAGGHDPCVGDPAALYYQTVPLGSDPVTLQISGTRVATLGTQIAKGASGTLKLRVYADGQAGPFKIAVDDYAEKWLGGTKLLQITLPATPVNTGDEIDATVQVLGQDPGLGAAEVFVVTTTPVAGGISTYYFGAIGQ